ncbi:hypothetical protein HY570_03120 [Candidatus Micrarchaeota archaeon]|nr:hypothetical protein [Candidatus Micrarchaeota archaeon]
MTQSEDTLDKHGPQIKKIIKKRLNEIKTSLNQLITKLDKSSAVRREAIMTIDQIDELLKREDVSELPKEVKVETSKAELNGKDLNGRILLSDNENVFDIRLEENKLINCVAVPGGFDRMKVLLFELKPIG